MNFIRLRMCILDFGHGMDLHNTFGIRDVTYVPDLGDIINLTGDQEMEICHRIAKSSYLKKVWAKKFIKKHGRISLTDKDIKDLTPKQIRNKISDNWYFDIPDLKVVKKNVTLREGETTVYIEVEFVDRWLQSAEQMVTVYLFPGSITQEYSPEEIGDDCYTSKRNEAFKIDLPTIPKRGDIIHLNRDQKKAWNKQFNKDLKYTGLIKAWETFYTIFDDDIDHHIQISCSVE